MIYDSTSVRTFMACERRFYWRHVRHMNIKERLTIPAFGIAIHEGLEEWYKSGDPKKSLEAFHNHWSDLEEEKRYTRENGEGLLLGYFKTYGKFSSELAGGVPFKDLPDPELYYAPNEPFEILGLEQFFACPLPTPEGNQPECPECSIPAPDVLQVEGDSDLVDLDKGVIKCRNCSSQYEVDIYCGRFDGVIKWGEMVLVIDHKTTGRLGDGSYYFKQFRPNLQMSGYVWAAQKIFQTRVHGVLINALHMTTRTINFARDISPREPWEIEQFLKIVRAQIELIRDRDPEDFESWQPNWTSCLDFRGCSYMDLCLTEEPERIVDLLYEESKWSPINHVLENGETG